MKIFLPVLFCVLTFILSCSKKGEEIPLPEHPRPDFERPVWQNLNGSWSFKPDTTNIGLSENWQDQPEFFDKTIVVPFSWASPLSDIEMPSVNIGWYSRTFKLENTKKWKDKEKHLVFSASDFNTTVWINGEEVGNHSGGYILFDFNISKFLAEGENIIVVRVEDEELDNRPSGKQHYGNAKGIWNTVYLEARPENYIRQLKFTPDIDKKQVTVEVQLDKNATKNLVFNLKGKNNAINFFGEIAVNQPSEKFIIPIENMKLWDLENPFLYEVVAGISGESGGDVVFTYFGMRKISAIDIPGKDFQYVALNNKPVYLKLALDQSFHPEGFYTFPSDQFMKEEIQRAKDLGLNGLRIHIKAEMPRKLYWADKLGLLIMQDIPNFRGEPDNIAKANWEYIAGKQIERDYNHPSLFTWVLFNETQGLFSKNQSGENYYSPETQEWVRSWYYKTKTADPTRLIEDNSTCNWDHVVTDINTWHRYSPARHWAGFLDMVVDSTFPGSSFNYIGENVQTNTPMFNSECGAVWGYEGSTGDIDITWEYHIMMNEFRKRPKIAGFLFTELHDVINKWNGYYRIDRSKKEFGLNELFPGMSIKDFHTDLYVVSGKDFFQTFEGGSEIEIPVGISSVTNDITEGLNINYSIYGWDEVGEKFDVASGELKVKAVPFSFTELSPVKINLPDKTGIMIFATTLKDTSGKIIQRNFVPFKINGKTSEYLTVTKSPSDFSESSWTIQQFSLQNGNKTWGMGSGYFEYQFKLPENLIANEVESIEFRAELASRFPQGKYLDESDAEKIGITFISEKGSDPGFGKNSYPQTDEKLHGSLVKITSNDQIIKTVELPDDPADHRGILSWMNQKPGWEWGNYNRDKLWLLDEAGSYGFLVKATFDESAKNNAVESGKVILRLYVDEITENRGGLSVYGKNSGMYPMDLTLLITKK